jgi:hypothetical protein
MEHAWTLDGTMRVAEDWLLAGLLDRRVFLAVSGAALTQAVRAHLAREVATPAEVRAMAEAPADPLVSQIEQSVPLLARLDDAQGGASHLTYVGAQVRAVALVLHEQGPAARQTRRLLVALADLAQLAGWMAFDAGQHGLAQRYFFTGLRAAHDAGYRPMAAHILADLAFQATSRGEAGDGVRLGEAADEVAAKSPASVRASVKTRLAYAYAGAGETRAFERTRHDAQGELAARNPARDPEWLYYLTPSHLDCQAGYSLVLMGRRQLADGDRSGGRRLLRQGRALLAGGAYAFPVGGPSERRALFEGAWLALGHAAHGDLEEACQVAGLATARLDQVRSPRSVALLDRLARDLKRRQRNPVVGELLPELERTLARQTATSTVGGS